MSSVIIAVVVVLGIIVAGGFLLYFLGDLLMGISGKKKDVDAIREKQLKKQKDLEARVNALENSQDAKKDPQIATVLFNGGMVEAYNPNEEEAVEETVVEDFEETEEYLEYMDNIKYYSDKKNEIFYEFIKDELGCSVDMVKVDSNLAGIINILFQDDLTPPSEQPEINSFEIQRKIDFNELSMVQLVIDDYKVYYGRINEKYEEFDKQGVNKSLSVLSTIRKEYINLSMKIKDTNELFLSIIDGLIDRIMNSRNYTEIPYDELEMCVSILVVDAFTRCKIFKNPEGYDYAVTR